MNRSLNAIKAVKIVDGTRCNSLPSEYGIESTEQLKPFCTRKGRRQKESLQPAVGPNQEKVRFPQPHKFLVWEETP